MTLAGSCHCGAVTFTVDVPEPVPYLRCYCSICRKTAGSGGYGINLGARTASLTVTGAAHIRRYNPATGETGPEVPELSGRRFCGACGSALWNFDARWPEFIHPHAGAIDSDLPAPDERVHMMLASAANWVAPDVGADDRCFDAYPDETLAEWHARVASDRDTTA